MNPGVCDLRWICYELWKLCRVCVIFWLSQRRLRRLRRRRHLLAVHTSPVVSHNADQCNGKYTNNKCSRNTCRS